MNEYEPKIYVLVEWPESRRVLGHPECKFLDPLYQSSIKGRDCIVPEKIWQEFKNSYYIDNTDQRIITILRDNNL